LRPSDLVPNRHVRSCMYAVRLLCVKVHTHAPSLVLEPEPFRSGSNGKYASAMCAVRWVCEGCEGTTHQLLWPRWFCQPTWCFYALFSGRPSCIACLIALRNPTLVFVVVPQVMFWSQCDVAQAPFNTSL